MMVKKGELHLRNLHKGRYDMVKLIECCPELEQYVHQNKYGNLSIDFFDPQAVKMLNKALLMLHYNISYWDIPQDMLTPPIPGRADYIHYVADLLGDKFKGDINCLDVGVGANCIFPIIGVSQYGWNFVGSDANSISVKNSQEIVDKNPSLANKVQIREQKNRGKIFDGIVGDDDYFHLVVCNPPFHSSAKEAANGTMRKLVNLKKSRVKEPTLNFGGLSSELWCDGGELRFIGQMIYESQFYGDQCYWFTTLVSSEDNLKQLIQKLKKVKVAEYKVLDMHHGNKKSRILAWGF